ncbi:hypothetical protein HHK36_027562 [Tetracentron sinense]|uniref:Uncharacterized protein n=1 Tax=Tetracentron sinense TaxID=13715 RepID=A0A835D163_TETSI|nr:hypothetical protein HHK36_027562 [Tetracentron sinense]
MKQEMAKTLEQNTKQQSEEAKSLLWDCGSSLYDSFELKSFERQLDMAISSRTYSMPRLSDPRAPPAPPQPVLKRTSKISRSFHKLLRAVFRSKPTSDAAIRVEERSQDGFYVVYDDGSGTTFTTIQEATEKGRDYLGVLPEFDSIVRRTASERFTATSIGTDEVSVNLGCSMDPVILKLRLDSEDKLIIKSLTFYMAEASISWDVLTWW